MPYENKNERMANLEGESPSPLCWESEGFLPETTIDLHIGSFKTLPLSLVVCKIEV
jgi:hypothetical protein